MKTILLFSIMIFISGCGVSMPSSSNLVSAPPGSYQQGVLLGQGSAGSTATNSAFTCPSSPNVTAASNSGFDSIGNFTVCSDASDNANILIHGSTQSGEVCVFPAQVIDSEHVYTKPDLSTGAPWYQCYPPSTGGIVATFSDINWNAAFIVEQTNVKQMQSCLIGGNYLQCPVYAFGKFE